MTDIKDRLHQMMLRSGFQSRLDQETLLAGVQEIERLRALLTALLAAADASDSRKQLFVGGELRDRVRRELRAYEQSPVSLAEMRKPEEKAKNERSKAAMDAADQIRAAHDQYMTIGVEQPTETK